MSKLLRRDQLLNDHTEIKFANTYESSTTTMQYCIGAGNSSITTTGPYNCTACKFDHIQVKLYNGYKAHNYLVLN